MWICENGDLMHKSMIFSVYRLSMYADTVYLKIIHNYLFILFYFFAIFADLCEQESFWHLYMKQKKNTITFPFLVCCCLIYPK